jgi:hypothetical protein
MDLDCERGEAMPILVIDAAGPVGSHRVRELPDAAENWPVSTIARPVLLPRYLPARLSFAAICEFPRSC